MTLNFNRLLILIVPFLALGCWSPSKDSSPSKSAGSFYVKEANGLYMPPSSELDIANTVWQSIDAHNYKFRVCLNDHYADQPVRQSPFKVTDEKGQTYSATTDAQGCLEWTERFAFNFYAEKSVYVLLDRKIKADSTGNDKSGHKGVATIQFAVNPWQPYRDPGAAGVIYLSGSKAVVPRGQLVTGSGPITQVLNGDVGSGSKLWMHNLKLISSRVEPTSSGHDVEIQIEMTPFLIVKDLLGEIKQVKVPVGQFKMQSYLLASDYSKGEKPLILNPQSPPATGSVFKNDGLLRFKIRTRIERRVSEGRLLLALKVLPINGPRLNGFEALHNLGELADLKGQNSPTLREEIWGAESNSFSFDSYISADNTANFEDLKTSQTARELMPIDFEIAQVRFGKYTPGETSTTRTVEYRMTTCLIDNLSLKRVAPGQKFTFSIEGGEFAEVVETDPSGCLRLIGRITHKYYASQRVIFQDIKIRKVSTCEGDYKSPQSKCFDHVLTVGINPWDVGFTFGSDAREFTEKYIKESAAEPTVFSTLVVDRYAYNTKGFRYEVDEFLNMKVIKSLYLRLEPMVLLHHSVSRGRSSEPLRDGLYLLKVAMHRDYLDSTSKNVHISNKEVEAIDMKTGKTGYVSKSVVEANPDQRPRTFVSVVKKVVRVQRGVIVTPVELRLRDLRLMSVRANLMVQLEPIDEIRLQQAIAVERKVNGMSAEEMKTVKTMLQDLQNDRQEEFQSGILAPIPGEESEEYNQKRDILKSQTLSEISGMFSKLQAGVARSSDPKFGPLDMDWLVNNKFISAEDRKKIEANNFNDSRLVSNFDYDLFVDKEAGLAKRTFVGPIRLLDNMSTNSMQPTDAINEDFCNGADCNQLENLESNRGGIGTSDLESAKYFGSIQHLHGIHVDDMIQQKIELETNYYREQYLGSLVSSFADTFNLKFVTLGNEVARSMQGTCNIQPRVEVNQFESWKDWQLRVQNELSTCLVKSPELQESVDVFLGKVNKKDFLDSRKLVESKDIETIITTGRIPKHAAERFCDYFTEHVYKPVVEAGPGKYKGRANSALSQFNHTCKVNFGNGTADSHQDSFIIDRKMRVGRVGALQYIGGKSVNLSVGSQFQLASVEGTNIHGTVGFDPLGVPVIRDIISSPAKGGINLNYNIARNRTDSTAVLESTYLVMQTSALKVDLTEYEQCAVVKINPKIRDMYAQLNKHFRPDLVGDQELLRQRHLAKGLYLCTGRTEKRPLPILERYFYMTQHFTEGDMQDTAEFYNRPWLLSLRGVRDMRTFLRYIREQDQGIGFDKVLTPLGQAEGDFFSINQLSQAYMRILPSFPGVYTLIDEKKERVQGLDFPSSGQNGEPLDKNLDVIGVGVDDIKRFVGEPPR